MNIIDIIMGRKRPKDAYRGEGGFISRWARPPSRNTSEWLATFSTSPRLAVVDRIASDIANVPGHLYRILPDGSEEEIFDHRFLDFLDQPNPLYEMTSPAIWRLHEIYLMLVGESFLLIERDERDQPVELWNVPPHWVSQTPYLGFPYYSIISPSGITMSVPVEDMFVMKQLNPLDPFMRGLGLAESVADEVEIDEYAAKFQKRFFYNDATPPVVFLMPGATEEQREAFMARWNQKHKGVENSHRAAALTGEVTIKEIGSGSNYGKNLGFLESREAMRDSILEHFGVPREIMGITENSNRATADSAQYIYAKNVLMPRILNREEAINKQLLPLFGYNLVWRYEAVVPYDKEFDKALALDGWNAGLLTKNEAREKLDLPETEGGDVFKMTSRDIFYHEYDDPVELTRAILEKRELLPGADEPGGGSDFFSEKADRRVNVEAMLKDEDELQRKHERRFTSALTRHFASQQAEITKAMGLTSKAVDTSGFEILEAYLLPDGTFDPELWAALTVEEQARLTAAIADGLLDWKQEVDKLVGILTPLWKGAYQAGGENAKKHYSLINLVRPEFVDPAKINGAKRVQGIQDTTRQQIADIIARGVEDGRNQYEIKKQIRTAMGPGETAARIKTIAQQETSVALTVGQFDTMKAAGATTKTWRHRDQKDPRDGSDGKANHVILDGETVGINERFSNGMMHPKDPEDDRPEELINCHCYLTFGGF